MLENLIIHGLITDDTFARKAFPYIKIEYFNDVRHKTLFKLISNFINKYNTLPSIESIKVDLSTTDGINEKLYHESIELIQSISSINTTNRDTTWLIDQAEKFCQDKALYNAIMQSIEIMDDTTSTLAKGSIPKLLQDALGVTFDSSIGHDYIESADDRYEFYHRVEEKIAFDLYLFNKITKGGVSRKTLTVVLAGTGVGKSLFMCHCAASNFMMGKNVLYITLEMSEEKITERIDANLMDVTIDDLHMMPAHLYKKKIQSIREKTSGKLLIKEYPTAAASAANFRALINELKIKKNFIPDVVYIDYLNICASSRIKPGSNINSYSYVKAIAEELRGLAIEFDLPIITATQTNRTGYSNSEVELTDTSESFGVPMSADIMFALINSEELESLGQIMVKQLKNRYDDPGRLRRFVIGVDRSKMKLYDVDDSAQEGLIDIEVPIFDSGDFAQAEKFNKNKFGDMIV